MSEELGAFAEGSFGSEGITQPSFPDLQLQAARQIAQAATLSADNVVVLAEGQAIQRLEADGTDLVIILTDGTRIVVPDGVIIVPQIIVEGTPIPPANVAALLVGNEPEPEAGNNPSSGGNFAVDPGAIQTAFDLGDLLPYTELPVNLVLEEEIIPFLPTDEEVTIFGLDGEAPEVVLDEDDLANPGDDLGSDRTDPRSFDGSFVVDSPDGLATVQINGVNVASNGNFAGPVEVANDGITSIVITGWTPVVGAGGLVIGATFSYRATLLDNTLDHSVSGQDSVSETLVVTATDRDGSSATANLDVQIVDDVPTAANDTDSIAAATFGPATGNVITDAERDGGADVTGADGITVTAAAAGTGALSALANGALVINGTYGVLTINANGSYSYTRNFNTPGGVSDVFTYRVTDGDGDTSTATLTIAIQDAQDRVTFVPETGDGTVVREPHLPGRDGEPAGSDFDGNPEATTGTITFVSPDGVQSVTLDGVVITPTSLPQTISSDETGTLIVTGYSYDPATGVGSVTYTYTLNDNTLDPDGTDVPVAIVVTDLDGDVANDTFTISIIDDVPEAADDTDSLTEGGPVAATGNVITDAEGDGGADVPGADGGAVETPGSFAGTYGTLVLGADGSYKVDYTKVHDKVASICPRDGTVTIKMTLGFTFDKPIMYLSTEANDPLVAALENATFTPAMKDLPFALEDASPGESAERIVVVVNGPTGKDNPHRQGLVSALSGEGGPLNVLGGIPTINLDYSPMWRLFPAVWTEEAIQKGYRYRMTSALQAAEMSHRGFIKSLDGGDFRAVGFIVNCPVVYRIN